MRFENKIIGTIFKEEKHNVIFNTDPRIKILLSTIITISTLLLWNAVTLALITAVVILTLTYFRVIDRQFYMFLEGILTFMIIFTITLSLTYSGDYHISLHILNISISGLILGLTIMLKAIIIVSLTYLMLKTTCAHDLLVALRLLKIPKIFIWILILAVRYVQEFLETSWRMYISLKLRTSKLGFNIHTLKLLGEFTVNLMIRCFEKCERIVNAMRLRISASLPDYTRYSCEYSFNIRIVGTLTVITCTILSLIFIDLMHYIPCLT